MQAISVFRANGQYRVIDIFRTGRIDRAERQMGPVLVLGDIVANYRLIPSRRRNTMHRNAQQGFPKRCGLVANDVFNFHGPSLRRLQRGGHHFISRLQHREVLRVNRKSWQRRNFRHHHRSTIFKTNGARNAPCALLHQLRGYARPFTIAVTLGYARENIKVKKSFRNTRMYVNAMRVGVHKSESARVGFEQTLEFHFHFHGVFLIV